MQVQLVISAEKSNNYKQMAGSIMLFSSPELSKI